MMTHNNMTRTTKNFIFRGLVFFCCGILLVFSFACKKTATISVPLIDEEQGETVQELLEKTRALQWKGEYDEAYDAYSSAIQLSPQDASLYFERGNISFLRLASLTGSSLAPDGRKLSSRDISLLVRRYCGLALYDFNEAISLDPHIDIFYYMRGSLQLFEASPCNNTAAAIENFDKAIQLNPSNAVYYMERGRARIGLGHYRQAAGDLHKAAAMKGHDYQFYYDIGKLYEKMKMKKEALSSYKQAMEQAPHDRLEILNRSLVLLRGGNHGELIQDYTELIAKRPEAAQFYAMRGHSYSESEKFPEAVKDYSVVLGFQPNNKEIYVSRGLLLDYLGRKEEGERDLQTACNLGHAKACSVLGRDMVKAAPEIKKEPARNTGAPKETVDTKKEAVKGANIPKDGIVSIEVAETGALQDAKHVKNTGNTEGSAITPQRSGSATKDGWIPFWHSGSDNNLYFYNMIKKTENNNMVRVRMESNYAAPEAYKVPLAEQKIDTSKPYTLEFWSFDCHLANANMMGRYSSDPQVVVSRSPYTNARQGAISPSPAGMIDELWKIVCGEKKRTTTNHTP
jgi:tetratricopeptide (TPR) repeat protein